MNVSAILTIARYILTAIGTFVLTKGWADQSTIDSIVGGLLMIIPAVLGLFVNVKKTATVEAAKTVLEQAPAPVSKAEVAEAAALVETKQAMQALLKLAPYVALVLILMGTHYWSYNHGLEHQKGLQAVSDNAELIKSANIMVDAFTHTNILLQELNDGSPDNQDAVPPGLGLTIDGVQQRIKANGQTNTASRNQQALHRSKGAWVYFAV